VGGRTVAHLKRHLLFLRRMCDMSAFGHMSLKRKVRRRTACRVYRSRTADGREVVLAPIVGKNGKVHRFIVLDKNDPLPIPRGESETYLRVD
jgi:hypothetical protein